MVKSDAKNKLAEAISKVKDPALKKEMEKKLTNINKPVNK